MEELNDDELQDFLDRSIGNIEHTSGEKATADLLAYQDLFKALQTEPVQGLPLSFASNVKWKLQKGLNRKSDLRFNILAAIIVMLSLLLAYGLLQLISQATAALVLSMVVKFKWVLASVIFLFFSFLLIDQRLIKREY
ncbi:hypothetical protein SAMN06265348_10721 [Pedobacter westerhofensis]|uniref:Uncharacterized protein n=1 Tax=Pedobacter westerhofensis TaxID=425512 RepID=A0A521E4K3_9SPHI|nr:hypothetical protein [Pedobacter westerhofensis]SMO78847.1 hypothetical protein SAMN06265348_10721 [Pedobacter westerhofensis]